MKPLTISPVMMLFMREILWIARLQDCYTTSGPKITGDNGEIQQASERRDGDRFNIVQSPVNILKAKDSPGSRSQSHHQSLLSD